MMKDYSCRLGHQFNEDECKFYGFGGLPACPVCLPNGFNGDKGIMEEEFGSFLPVQFARGNMYDNENKLMLCKCGKPAASGIIGKKGFQVFCNDCSPCNNLEAQFIYKPPKKDYSGLDGGDLLITPEEIRKA